MVSKETQRLKKLRKEFKLKMDERSRQSLVRKLEGVLGPEDALTLMASLPPLPWSDLATKKDLEDLRLATKKDLEDLREGTKRDLEGLEERVNLRMDSLGATLRGEMKDLSRELTLTMVTTFQAQTRTLMIGLVGTMIAFGGVVLGALKLG